MQENSCMRSYDYYVYMLRCSDGSYYTGITNSVERRLWQHQQGINPACYTFSRRPVELVHSAWFTDAFEAIHWDPPSLPNFGGQGV